ncbi:hypothetical protein D6851_15710 [Altericroceibacterium spongiae]|uniref:Uncharacterized protein n=1 Tax=Altericroceibacterium spongiae TaxID=2320269 RepID=A0A420EAM8_9SPHN|nr:hypothetical protein [Altericroceibacterium spongiae]RKF17704.1 hypothetical protein D6851_15710 [Altericroceibacterium spongiae]
MTKETLLEFSQTVMALTLQILGWVISNTLITIGTVSFFFFSVGNFTIAGTMHQLLNLSGRYVAADISRQLQFNDLLGCSILIVFLATAFLRRSVLIRIFDETGRKYV